MQKVIFNRNAILCMHVKLASELRKRSAKGHSRLLEEREVWVRVTERKLEQNNKLLQTFKNVYVIKENKDRESNHRRASIGSSSCGTHLRGDVKARVNTRTGQ